MTQDSCTSAIHFDPDTAVIRVAEREVQLTPTQASMLCYFIEHKSRTIPKQELLEAVWPDTYVTDSLVKDYVRHLRRLLKDDHKQPQFIDTVRGIGYRFIGDVRMPGVDDLLQSSRAAAHLAPSIAVLPFTNASDDNQQAYFSAGITEEIISDLSRFRSLTIIARDSTFLYDSETTADERVGRELDAQYLLRGSVWRAGDRLRIHARLVEAESDICLWADSYERTLGDLFPLLAEVSGAIVETLVGHLETFGQQRALQKAPKDLAAYDCLLLGNWHARQGDRINLLEARTFYQRAIELEPTSGRAHSEMALSYLLEFWSDWAKDYEATIAQAHALAKKAVALDALDNRAHLYLAVTYQSAERNFALAEEHFRISHELNPYDYDFFCLRAWYFAYLGRTEEGIACAAYAVRLSPLTTIDCYQAHCVAAYGAGRYEEALLILDKIPEASNSTIAYRAMCYAQLGREQDAQRAMTNYLANASSDMTTYPGKDGERWQHYWAVTSPFKDPKDLAHLLAGLRKAGLP